MEDLNLIKSIPSSKTFELRNKILRPNQTIEACKYPGDNHKKTFHLGAFCEDKLFGIASFYWEPFDNRFRNTYRLRGMAVMDEAQGKGVGSDIMQASFARLKKTDASLLWANARTSALNFYTRLGFDIVGKEFEIEGIGPHYKVIYDLKKSHRCK